MEENTKKRFDWKGILLKVSIGLLIILITIIGCKIIKNVSNKNKTTTKVVEQELSTTFIGNISKLKIAGEEYYKANDDKLPKDENNTTMVTLKELIDEGVMDNLVDENGNNCDNEGSYVKATMENKQIKLKANLICGESSSYSVIYMGGNDSELQKEESNKEESNNDTDKSLNINSSETSADKNTNSTEDKANDNTIKTEQNNTSEKKDDTINSNNKDTEDKNENITDNNTNKDNNGIATKYYTVKFNKNGGSTYYRNQEIKENGVAKNPGDNYKSGYNFIGWYLNGKLFDFNTPITSDIELIAKYSKNNSNTSNDDSDTNEKETFNTYVYSLGWEPKGTDKIEITHTLKVPEEKIENIEKQYDIEIEEIKIKDIVFMQSFTSEVQLNQYYQKHEDTFIYKNNSWDADIKKMSNLSTIVKDDVEFGDYNKRYVDIGDAKSNGFEVTWKADNVKTQCRTTFSVNEVANMCGYGIVYKVTWEYKFSR